MIFEQDLSRYGTNGAVTCSTQKVVKYVNIYNKITVNS